MPIIPPTPMWAVRILPFFVSAHTPDGNMVIAEKAAALFRKSLLFMIKRLNESLQLGNNK
jgi:hypothetical protein